MDQLHLELVASMKVFTELTKADVSTATVAMLLAEGLDGNESTVVFSVFSEDSIALVSFGKSLLADLTRLVALVLILFSCASRPLMPLLRCKSVRPLTEFSR